MCEVYEIEQRLFPYAKLICVIFVIEKMFYVTCTVHFQLYICYADKCTQFYVI
jgi:hypothetical protein